MSKEQALYELIVQNMINGELPSEFSLPKEKTDNGVVFADGAMDGIFYYHMGRPNMDADGTNLMIRAVELAAVANLPEADTAFSELGRKCAAINTIDHLQNYIRQHAQQLPAENIYQTAVYLLLHSANKEAVKYGLCMLELFSFLDEPVKEAVRRIGLSDEFTIFAVWNMYGWDNGNEEIFQLIRKVHGWGRIHALEKLEPETTEIREWILREGIQNEVMEAYSALTVWEKADVASRLKRDLTEEEFKNIGSILAALTDEGPVPGISTIDDAEEQVMRYLSAAGRFKLDQEDRDNISVLQTWLAEKKKRDSI